MQCTVHRQFCSSAGVKVGDILVIFPDEDSLEVDRGLGYFLKASFGKVWKIEGLSVHLHWMFTEKYSSKLRPWYLQGGQMHSGIIQECEIFTGDTESIEPLKAMIDSNNRLKKVTKLAIIDVIGQVEFKKYA
jgi:hypothetical protein